MFLVVTKRNNSYFYVKDHLGNNRIVTDASGANVLQSNEYYPFGMLMSNSTHADKQPYKYGNKELDTSFDLNWYDFSARYQDGIRFTSIDPLAERYYSISPYVYTLNNPIRFADPDGEAPRDVLRGFVQGYTGFFKAIGHAVSHPIETFNQAVEAQEQQTVGERLGNALMNAADMSTMGAASRSVNFVKALASDINGGDGSATGEVLGGAATEGTIAIATAKIAEGAGKIASKVGANTSKNLIEGTKSGASTKSLAEQATDLVKLNGGKNSVTLGTPKQQIRYDLQGKAHNGVETPHKQIYNKNFHNGVQKSITRESKDAYPMTQQEIRMIRKYLEKINKN